jgi:hypothetical protein
MISKILLSETDILFQRESFQKSSIIFFSKENDLIWNRHANHFLF